MQRTDIGLVGLLAGALVACSSAEPSETRLRAEERENGAEDAAEPSPETGLNPITGGDASEPMPAGGQSGTDRPGSGEPGLPCPDLEPLDRGGVWQGVSVAELISRVVAPQSMTGEWVGSDAYVDLEISVTDLGGGVRTAPSERWECDLIHIPIEVSLRIGQSFAVGPLARELTFAPWSGLITGVDFDATAFAASEQVPEQLYEVGGGAELILLPAPIDSGAFWPPPRRSATIRWGARNIGEFGETGRRLRHFPLPDVADDCRRAELTDVESFSDESEALQAISGQWAICDAGRRLPFAGIEIRNDRTWSSIRAEAGLELGMGFGEEGTLRLSDTSVMNGPGRFQLNVQGPLGDVPGGGVARSVSGNTLRWGDTLAVKLTRPVRPAEPPQFAVGDRAGSAGCGSNETQHEPWPLNEASLNETLVGSWAICSGGAGTLRFDASGQLEFLDTSGVSTRREAYAGYPDTSMGGSASGHVGSLTLGEGDGNERWYIVRTSRPVKIQAMRRTINTEQERLLDTLVLSAMPE